MSDSKAALPKGEDSSISRKTVSEGEKEDGLISAGGSETGQTSDTGSNNFNAIDFDSFAMTSLQATASAILAAQQHQSTQVQQQSPISPFDQQQQLQFQAQLQLQQQKPFSPSREQDFQLHSNVASGSESETGQARQASTVSLRRGSSQGRNAASDKPHLERHMWTPDETQALVNGCNKHGIGNWKAILNDQQFAKSFEGRTPGDLKDRFRTYFPDAYHEMYPNAKTHTSRAVRSKAPDGTSIFEKGKTKERRPFTPAEDDVLKRGYEKYGSHWAIIAKEPVFEGKRKSTDLRDRFRNAFPNLYEQAGYKPRSKAPKKERRQSSSGSMSQSERPTILTTGDFRGSFSFGQTERPALAPRSETSTSVHSQAVSEHSEEESDYHHEVHIRDRSDGSFIGYADTSLQSAASSIMSRSHSVDHSVQSQGSIPFQVPQDQLQAQQLQIQQAQPAADQHAVSGSSGASSVNAGHRHPLRRSHSSKRGSTKIPSLEKAAKSASIKCNKEAILASHQQQHLQYLQQQQQRIQVHAQAIDQGWPQGFNWESGTTANLADMDLDQIGELMDAHSATQLLNDEVNEGMSERTDLPTLQGNQSADSMSSDESSNNAILANLYQQFDFSGAQTASLPRVEDDQSYQHLISPLEQPQSGQTNFSNLSSSSLPFNPVTSTASSQLNMQSLSGNTNRRDHEHNQWAGDLLHRGNPTSLDWDPQAFVNMANMQLLSSTGQQSSSDNNQGVTNDREVRPGMPNEHSWSTPSIHDLISKSNRRLSNPPRPVGLHEELTADSLLSSVYRPSTLYPADDISLINPNFAMTLFPSLMGTGPASDGGGPSMRRRKSTDTLRENTFSAGHAWRGPMEGIQANQSEDGMGGVIDNSSDLGGDGNDPHSSSQPSGQHSRSISSVDAFDDDQNVPSRAASVGDLDLIGVRENVLYAESLPDLTSSAFGGEHSSSTSENAFPHVQHLQMSYDDLDLPSFLNRSPNFQPANANTMNPISATTYNSPRMAAIGNDGTNWLKLISEARGNVPQNPPSIRDSFRSASVGVGEGPSAMLQNPQSLSQNAFDVVGGGGNNNAGGNGSFTNFAASLNDAGALDRLEHLYLEGLHTSGSPVQLYANISSSGTQSVTNQNQNRFGMSSSNSFGQIPSSNQLITDRSSGNGGGEPSNGYESV